MYADWSSLTHQLQVHRQLVGNKNVFRSFNLDFKGLGLATQSVLAKLPAEDGKQVMC